MSYISVSLQPRQTPSCDWSQHKLTDEDTVKRYYAKFEEKFFQTCEKELAKINTFYSEKLAEAQRRFATLQNELQSSLDAQRESWANGQGLRRRKTVFALSQQERCKHRKHKGPAAGLLRVLPQPHTAAELSELEGGDRQRAMKRLRVPPLGAAQPAPAWTTFRVGLYCGVFLVLMVTVVITGLLGVLWCVSLLSCLFSHSILVPMQANPLALYGIFLLFLINPFKTCYYKSRFWLLKLLFRVVTAPFHHVGFADFWLADQLNSLVVVLMDLEYMICFYSFELDWKKHDGLISSSGADVCNSYSYGVRAVIQCLPAWFRFVQCLRRYRDTKRAFPHLVNAGKYSTSFFVVTFSALYNTHKVESHADAQIFFYLYISCLIVSSCYTLVWDLKMDWGLFDRNAGENTFLREEIVYPQKAYYYSAIVEDVLLRFAWTLTVSLTTVSGISNISDILSTILAPMEVFRRFVWNFFRLENEHLNNCGEFRAVRDISVAPLNADDQTLLEQMMDQEDGVRNRQGKKSWKRSYSMSLRRPRLASQSKTRDTKVLIEDTDDDS
ncbi:Xenotropic and polytropic retrovirus receptor 1 -like protein [Collichthys lucidus]|uniref:Xenotropic and polytropic retrovirus receptor 1-like protein n=1 Tax=Collichthys lucidus TaxID=240159 RepID=A0A4U5UYG7_COLLU|nr:Xenotropic and polytropic retrovirus receptor 1 -like protein [Collichthys lucidus]